MYSSVFDVRTVRIKTEKVFKGFLTQVIIFDKRYVKAHIHKILCVLQYEAGTNLRVSPRRVFYLSTNWVVSKIKNNR